MAVKPVAQWTTYHDVKAAVDADLPADYEVCRRMVEDGDHWLGGEGWIGHRTGDAVVDGTLRARIEPQFVSDDVIGELVENRTSGLVGLEADISLDPLETAGEDAEQAGEEVTAILGALAQWWDQKRLWEKVALASDRVSWARRGSVWPFVADGNLQRTETTGPPTRSLPQVTNLEEALDLIDVDAPAPNAARRYVDPTTGRAVAIILTRIGEQNRAQVWSVNPATKQTEVKVYVEGGGTPAGVSADLGGRIPFGEIQGKRIVTPSLRRSQMLLNFIMTVTGRTVETAGFRERHILNAEPELLWLTSAPAFTPVVKTQKNDAGQVIAWGVRMPRTMGAGYATEVQGLEIDPVDGKGPPQVLTPSVQWADPVDPAFATSAADTVTTRLYKRGKQGHLGLAKTGETSGVAYQQARAQFESDLRRLKGPCEGMIRDTIEGALALAGQMSAEAKGVLQRYRVVVNLRISAGPITPEESQTAVTLRDAGVISRQSAQSRVGVEDPDAEQEAIDSDKLAAISTQLKMQKDAGLSSPTLNAHMLFLAADKQGLVPADLVDKIKAELTEKAIAKQSPDPETPPAPGGNEEPPNRRPAPPTPSISGQPSDQAA